MKRQAYESIFTIYDSDNQVSICESRRKADAVKRRFSRLVSVEGPFEHPRHELPLVIAAAQTLKLLREIQLSDRSLDLAVLFEASKDLEFAIQKVFPFPRVRLKDGQLFDIEARLPNELGK